MLSRDIGLHTKWQKCELYSLQKFCQTSPFPVITTVDSGFMLVGCLYNPIVLSFTSHTHLVFQKARWTRSVKFPFFLSEWQDLMRYEWRQYFFWVLWNVELNVWCFKAFMEVCYLYLVKVCGFYKRS